MEINKIDYIFHFFSCFLKQKPRSIKKLKKVDILLACHKTNMYEKINNLWISPILESLNDKYKNKYGKKIARLIFAPCDDKRKELLKETILINHQIFKIQLLGLAAVLKNIFFSKKNNKTIDYTFELRVKFYQSVLVKLKPKIIIGISLPPEFCQAAHLQKIKTIEPMHGHQLHFSDKLFIEKFRLSPHLIPDAFLSFDKMTHKTLQKIFKKTGKKSFFRKHPWHQFQKKCFKENFSIYQKSSLQTKLASFKKIVLISLQWGYSNERKELSNIIPNGVLHPSIIQAIEETQNTIFWILRLHPVLLRGFSYRPHRQLIYKIEKRFINTDASLNHSFSLPLLLKLCDGHLTMCSGVIREAANHNVPSLALCPSVQKHGHLSKMLADIPKPLIQKRPLISSEILDWLKTL